MKKIALFLLFVLCHLNAIAQLGYWCENKFITLKPVESKNCKYVQALDTESKIALNDLFVDNDQKGSKTIRRMNEDRFFVDKECDLSGIKHYESTIFKNSDGEEIIIFPRIVVKIEDGYSIDRILEQFDGKIKMERNERNRYILSCLMNSSEEMLGVLQIISKLEGIKYAVPEMTCRVKPCNTLYPYQYYLNNTSTGGVDINVVPVWSITNGSSNVTVAVIDNGVERSHEDLSGNVLNGYTIGYPSGYGEPQQWDQEDKKAHGTACAGIIAAKNNQIGIRGIASGSKILPVNIEPYYYDSEIFVTNIEISNAIRWAYPRADILNFSSELYDDDDIHDAINDAMTYGRNGKGCVVVASSGNTGDFPTNVARPARYGGVIAVGAVLSDGTIWAWSQQGDSLDIVAPGGNFIGQGNIVTTDRMAPYGYVNYSNYVNTFGATSASCAEVSGIAALMLSVNPNLTSGQVRNVLRSTATDLGPIGFDTAYGYGLVNATKAVLSVMSLNIEGSYLINSSESYYVNNLPYGFTVTWSLSNSYYNSNCLQQNSPSANRCTITRNSSHDMINATLTASIKRNGTTVYTLTKTVSTAEAFTGTYYNGQTTKQISYPSTLYVLGGTDACITSPNLIGASVTYEGNATPYVWSLDSNSGILHVGMPSTGGYAITVHLTTALGNHYVLPILRSSSVSSMSVSTSNNQMTITLAANNDDMNIPLVIDDGISKRSLSQQALWYLEVYNTTTSRKLIGREILGDYSTIDTSGWKPGVYIVKVTIGDKILSEKVVVK